jgi:hypothetical protein
MMRFLSFFLIKESGLLVFDAQFAVNGSKNTLYLTKGKHTAKKGVTSIVTVVGLIHHAARNVGEGHTVVHTHRQLWVLFFEDAAELDEVGATAQVTGLREVSVGEYVARTQVNEVSA